MSGSSGPLARLRRPEYTGANRCWPCTVANLAIAALGATNVYLWGVVLASATVAVATASAVAACSLAMVWLRGYLVPGTPRLSEFLPAAVLGVFGKDVTPTVARGVTGPPTETDGGRGGDPVAVLHRAGVLNEDGRLSGEFRTAWDKEVTAADPVDGATLADRFDLPAGTAVGEVGRGVAARANDERVATWPSVLAVRTDLAGAAVLADRVSDWGALTPGDRGRACAELRAKRETCPDCGGSLSTGSATVRSCCGHRDVVATECVDCGARLVERGAD